MIFNRCPNATFPCPDTPLMVKNQSRQITSKSIPLERARKTKHFSYKNLCLEMSRSKDMSTLIWSGDPTQENCQKRHEFGTIMTISSKLIIINTQNLEERCKVVWESCMINQIFLFWNIFPDP